MRPTFDRRLWILLFIILIRCIYITNQQNIQIQSSTHHHSRHQEKNSPQQPAESASSIWRSIDSQSLPDHSLTLNDLQESIDDSEALRAFSNDKQQQNPKEIQQNCAKNCLKAKNSQQHKSFSQTAHFSYSSSSSASDASSSSSSLSSSVFTVSTLRPTSTAQSQKSQGRSFSSKTNKNKNKNTNNKNKNTKKPSHLPSSSTVKQQLTTKVNPAKAKAPTTTTKTHEHKKVHVAHRNLHREVELQRNGETQRGRHKSKTHQAQNLRERTRRAARPDVALSAVEPPSSVAVGGGVIVIVQEDDAKNVATLRKALDAAKDFSFISPSEEPLDSASTLYFNETYLAHFNASNDDGLMSIAPTVGAKSKRTRSTAKQPSSDNTQATKHESVIIIDDVEEFDSGSNRQSRRHETISGLSTPVDKSEDYSHDEPLEPRVLPLRPVLPNPFEDEEMSVVYAEQHSEIRLMCEVDLDISASMWYKNGQVVHAMDRTSRATDYRFIKEANGALTISNVMLEDDGKWQCEAENTRRYTENARPVKLVVLDRPKPPYLLIDSRRLDAGNIFVPVKENSELNLACVSEGGNPKPTLTWEVLLSPGGDRHAQKVSAEVLELEEVKNNKDKNSYKINSGAKSEARLPAVYRAHHNARILCVMEHPTLKIRQNASLLLDVQYTPSFAISRTPGFGYPLREGIEVSLKCDVDSNPPSTPRWQKDDAETPVPQTGDGFLNFTSIRREHSGWYKCTSRHLNFQYSSIGYYLSVRYDSVDVTSEPDDQDVSVAAASHNPNKGQLEVQLGGAVTLQCPQGSLGCWSHLDPVTARLRGLGHGLTTPTGQFSLKDVVYHDAGVYKCIGQSATNKKKLEVLQTVGLSVKGAPSAIPRNSTPVAYPGSPLHLTVEFCANPPAHAARWLHGDRVYTPGNQYGSTVLAYGVTDLPTPYCKEARLTYVSMHERVPRTFYFIVSSPGGVAEAIFKVNFTMRYRTMSNNVDDEEEELSEPEEIHFPVFGSTTSKLWHWMQAVWLTIFSFFCYCCNRSQNL